MIKSDEMMDYIQVVNMINQSIKSKKTIEIYYPKTQNSPEGWREIEPFGFFDDIEEGATKITSNFSPGHILKAYTIGDTTKTLQSFIIGKIIKARKTNRKFLISK
ncbi:MAG: hypothetical protein BWY34_00139 [Parcubacteria group bacterium ADurb.Bin247]|jgi:hypothetical protein|nr:MAG: hypothetical protein BWY34_00139 [Parcubacteria group bacterium ADurb.Bin247]HQB18650.1 hypothetical protein [Candidatus Pacearchaeota archaeon]